MAFVRYAKPVLAKVVNEIKWERIRVSYKNSLLSKDLSTQASKILNEQFDPKNYLLSHCTIMSSVDTYQSNGIKLGSVVEGGSKIKRKYSDFRIKQECDKFINDNNDAWRRQVLLKSYPTFIGANNYIEHVQIPEKSKGKVIDAVARDIGPSIYIDLLIATDRKHVELVQKLISGEINSMSMGCIIEESTCTKCGNVAVDEPEMCNCVKYEKGNYFFDEMGRKVRISELCGHESINKTAGVVFNDASWVEVPAFRGAVLRSLVSPIDNETINKARLVLASPPEGWTKDDIKGILKIAAQVKQAAPEDEYPDTPIDDDPTEDDPTEGDPADQDDETDVTNELGGPPEIGDLGSGLDFGFDNDTPDDEDDEDKKGGVVRKSIETVADEITQRIVDGAEDRAVEILSEGADGEIGPGVDTIFEDGISGTNVVAALKCSPVKLIKKVASLDRESGVNKPIDLYLSALESGGIRRFGGLGDYLNCCELIYGKDLENDDLNLLIRVGNLLDNHES